MRTSWCLFLLVSAWSLRLEFVQGRPSSEAAYYGGHRYSAASGAEETRLVIAGNRLDPTSEFIHQYRVNVNGGYSITTDLPSTPKTPHSDRSSLMDRPRTRDDSRAVSGSRRKITTRMRTQLLALRYTPAEIEDMNPEVAAVVIERKLHRPRNGMPDAWRRPAIPVSERKERPEREPVEWGQHILAVPRALLRVVTLPLRVIFSGATVKLLKVATFVSMAVLAAQLVAQVGEDVLPQEPVEGDEEPMEVHMPRHPARYY